MSSRKITIVALLLGSLVLIALSRQISDALNAGGRLDQAVERVGKLQNENKNLKKKLTEVQSKDFMEETARNKLNLAKPNETVVIIPPELLSQVLSSQTKVEEPKLPNWQGWLKLFIK